MTLINIPFAGFYESLWSDLVDHEVKQFAEHETEKQESRKYYPESYFPEPLQLDFGDAWECMDYSAAYQDVARDYAESFGTMLGEWAIELDPAAPAPGLTFSRLDSPREYNFRTDDIDAEISPDFVEWLFRQSARDDHKRLAATLERRHKSRDGFHSFYSWRLADWLAKPVDEWDYHELRSLLESVFPALADDRNEWEMGIYYSLSENAYSYFDSHFDFDKWEGKVMEARAEKLAEWVADDPQAAGEWAANNPEKAAPLNFLTAWSPDRCPFS